MSEIDDQLRQLAEARAAKERDLASRHSPPPPEDRIAQITAEFLARVRPGTAEPIFLPHIEQRNVSVRFQGKNFPETRRYVHFEQVGVG